VASRQSAIDTGDYDGRPLRRLQELAARASLIRGCCLIRNSALVGNLMLSGRIAGRKLRTGRNFEK